jgi:DNA-binding IclR family transcriptional regulator
MPSSPSPRATGESVSGTESADRVADVLVSFTRSDRPLGVSQIARDLGLSKAVVHRILQSLASRSLVQVVPGDARYALGPTAVGLGTKAWSQLDVRSLAAPMLRRLRDQTRETATLSVLVGNRRIYLDQYESPQEVKMVIEIGPQFPLHTGASSRSILAFLPQAFIDEVMTELIDVRPTVDAEEYLRGLAQVREQGYATSTNERNTGAASIAAPFFDASGNVLGSISSSGPAARYAEPADAAHQEHVAQVLSAAHAITQVLQPARA